MGTLPDRRRLNGPPGGTVLPVFTPVLTTTSRKTSSPRARLPGELRKIFLKTGFVPSSSGSVYYEVHPAPSQDVVQKPSLKLTCTVHGPRPLPRSAPFSPQLVLSVKFKFAPFATAERRSHLPDSVERDLSAHLETALRGVILAERWPKSGLDVIITVLEGDDEQQNQAEEILSALGLMNILAGSVTAASAAIVDAGIDCVDIVTGGVAAIVSQPDGQEKVILDPCPSDNDNVEGSCLVSHLHSRGEITDLWATDNRASHSTKLMDFDTLVNNAIEAASGARLVVIEALAQARSRRRT